MEDVYSFDSFWWFNIAELRFGPYEAKANAARMMKLYVERIDSQNRIDKEDQ